MVFLMKTIAGPSRMWVLFALLILLIFPSRNNLLAEDWKEFKPGIAKRTFTASVVNGGDTLEINAVRIDPTRTEIKVINVYGTLSKQKAQQFPAYTLREIISLLKPQVIINGGFSASYSLPLSSGLMVVNKKVISHLNTRSRTQTGIFCVENTRFKIVKKEEYNEKDCVYALQAGPILVEWLGKIAIFQNERQKGGKYRRSVIAIDKQGRLLLVTSSRTYLYDLANMLVKRESQGGLDCVVALNLSGDEESGLYVSHQNMPVIIGNIDVPVSSAIAVFGRDGKKGTFLTN
jgi:uncharacterized protein YigE (DUF2233 family)